MGRETKRTKRIPNGLPLIEATVRIPEELHRVCREMAQRDNVSFSRLINVALIKYLEGRGEDAAK
jgi:hypothetical protein